MTRVVRRLYDLEIDEVSLVDRPANQHGIVAIAKRAEEGMPEIFDPDGALVDEDSLEHGDVVYDGEGNEFVYLVADEADEPEAEAQEPAEERELATVGKAAGLGGLGGTYRGSRTLVGRTARRGAQRFADTSPKAKRAAAAAAGGAAAFGAGRMSKGTAKPRVAKGGLGESVYEMLSKALNDGERDEVVAKLADEVEVTKRENDELRGALADLIEDRNDEYFAEIAKNYNLPVAPEALGRILKNAAATMDDEDLAELDRLLTAQSAIYDELGTSGSDATSEVMDQVQALALETVGKAAAGVTVEQATAALFDANPTAYDEYLAEGM